MWFLYAVLIVGIINLMLWWLNSIKATNMFKKRYPDLKIARTHWSDKIIAFVGFVALCFCPIMNLFIGACMIYDSDELCERTVRKIYLKSRKDENTCPTSNL